MTTFYQLPEAGEAITLHTHFVVREDAQQLYGFYQQRDRQLFRTLIKVSGVGPKMALAILSGMEAEAFVECVNRDDPHTLVGIPGVGKKTAERLIVEMRDRLKDWAGAVEGAVVRPQDSDTVVIAGASREAEDALIALGYKPREAARAVARIYSEGANSEELIRLALKGMVS